eukprot:966280_1
MKRKGKRVEKRAKVYGAEWQWDSTKYDAIKAFVYLIIKWRYQLVSRYPFIHAEMHRAFVYSIIKWRVLVVELCGYYTHTSCTCDTKKKKQKRHLFNYRMICNDSK